MAISLETAMQNVNLPYMMLNLSFPSPFIEISLMSVVSYYIFSIGPILLGVYPFYEAYKKLRPSSPAGPMLAAEEELQTLSGSLPPGKNETLA